MKSFTPAAITLGTHHPIVQVDGAVFYDFTPPHVPDRREVYNQESHRVHVPTTTACGMLSR